MLTPGADFERASSFALSVFRYLEGSVISGMIYLGENLGLYRAMQGAGPLTSDELAERTGLHPRWIKEWLHTQAAAKLVDYADGRFELTPDQAAVLADEENSVLFSAGQFAGLIANTNVLELLPDAFRTGIGVPYDAHGREGNHAVARGLGVFTRFMLVSAMLPALDGVVDKLTAGARVADVGCGAGVALLEMAKAFPTSEFHGYELSARALELAAEARASARVTNATFHDVRGEQLPADASFDLVLTFDCLHDMTRPREVVGAIRRAIRDDGTYFIADIKAHPTFEENLDRNPMVALMYGMSVISCLSSAMSEPDGEGLGTLGLHTELAREMTSEAGFTRFTVHDFGNPAQLYYEVRP